MNLKKLGAVLIAVVALGAIGASSASAAATTTAAEVYTGASPGTTLANDTKLNLNIKSGTTATLKTKVGSAETPLELSATAFSCKGVPGSTTMPTCTITNKEITSKSGKVAYGTGMVLFENVTVTTPGKCAVVSVPTTGETPVTGQVMSTELVAHADFMNGTTPVIQLIPAAGAGTSFAAFEIVNNGGTCAVAGLYNVKGTLFADATNTTGTFAASQELKISPAIETADGGGLTIGSKAAELTATGTASLDEGNIPFAIK